MSTTGHLRLALAALAAGCALAAPPASALVVGIADQRPAVLADPQLRALHLTTARVVFSWDDPLARPARVDAWLQAARAAGLDPVVGFNDGARDACPDAPCVLPSVADYRRSLTAFHARWPWVRTLSAWNEPNVSNQPTWRAPERVAAYYQAAREVCPACTVLASEVLDNSYAPEWMARFVAALPAPPELWGLHNYEDVNHFSTAGTDAVLAAVPGRFWITETGGLVRYADARGRVTFPPDEQRAADATRFAFDLAARYGDRVERLYLYEWRSEGPGDRFDSGLLRADGSRRPSFAVLLDHLPATVAPAPVPGRLRLARGAARRSGRSGVRVAVTCVGDTPCAGRVELRSARRGHRLLGAARVSVAPGEPVELVVRLRRAALRRAGASVLIALRPRAGGRVVLLGRRRLPRGLAH